MQNTWFLRLNWLVSKSLKRVTKIPWTKFWKFCLSLFRNWKVHPRVSHETFCVSSRLELPLVTKLRKWTKPRNFEKFSKCFSWLGDSLTRESRELLSKLATGMTCERVAKNRVVKNFAFFEIFQNKTLSKNN